MEVLNEQEQKVARQIARQFGQEIVVLREQETGELFGVPTLWWLAADGKIGDKGEEFAYEYVGTANP